MKNSQDLLLQAGFQAMVIEDFYDTFLTQLLSFSPSNSNTTLEKLLNIFQTPEESNSIVVYLRFLTSAYLKLHCDDYLPFILADPSLENCTAGSSSGMMDHFCNFQVEAMGRESDEIHIMVLAKVLKVKVRVVYLDGRGGMSHEGSSKVNSLDYNNDNEEEILVKEPIVLLYRPGHYDMLYQK